MALVVAPAVTALVLGIQGANHTGMDITWTRDDGAPQDLSVLAPVLSARLQPCDANGISTGSGARAATGTFTITGATGGNFHWNPSAADVATTGYYLVQFIATYSDGTIDKTYPTIWLVTTAL